jgi:hypothetical protein
MGRIEWKGKYKFVEHPERRIVKKEQAEIDAYVDMLNGE